MWDTAGEVRTKSCDVLFWTPNHGHTSAGRPARTYIHHLCADTRCCLEDQPRVMNDWDGWRERKSGNSVRFVRLGDDDDDDDDIKKLATIVEGDLKVPFSLATTPMCRRGRYSFHWIAPLYPWSVPYNAERETRWNQVPFLVWWHMYIIWYIFVGYFFLFFFFFFFLFFFFFSFFITFDSFKYIKRNVL